MFHLLIAAVLTPTPPPVVSNLMFIEELLNDRCRGGSGDDPDTLRACSIRDGLLQQIEKEGWCWGHAGQIGADKTWEPCLKPKD